MADLAGLAQEGFPGFGQGQLAFAARSLDQLGAVIVLQCFDLGAEGRLGQGQFFGSCGQVACFGDGDKITVKFKIHSSPLKNIRNSYYNNKEIVFYFFIPPFYNKNSLRARRGWGYVRK